MMCGRVSRRISDDEDSTFNFGQYTIAIFSIIPANILCNDPVGIEERLCSVLEIETSVLETGVALSIVPFKLYY